ncbi:MAG: 16S rRNA (cytosine(967)-C(5))-methyltransferase RsmB [Clostridia bacterium]
MKDRLAAFECLYDVLNKGSYSNLSLDHYLGKYSLDGIGRAFATAIVMGTLKNAFLLDEVLGRYAKGKTSPSVRIILMMGIHQILHMDRTPDSAICNESVKISAKYAGTGSKGFVNAVLRNIARDKENVLSKIPDLPLHIRYSCTKEMETAMIGQFGSKRAEEILAAFQKPPSTCVRLNTARHSRQSILEALEAEGYEWEEAGMTGVYLKGNRSPAAGLCHEKGLITIQDEGSQRFVPLLDPKQGEQVLDACAGPGGKTTHLAEHMNNTGGIIACDIYLHKIQMIMKNVVRTGFDNVTGLERDMTLDWADFNGTFDRILIDAPCSGLGTCQKRPEIKLFYRPSESLVNTQQELLNSCSRHLKPGGVMVYGTCTLLDEENKEVVERFLENHPGYKLMEVHTILPDGKTGGFYMARMARMAS